MKNSLWILLFLVFWMACSPKTNTSQSNKDTLPEELQTLVEEMAKENILSNQFMGKTQTESVQFTRFRRMQELASEAELLQIAEYPHPVVRCYAFWALAKIQYKSLDELAKAHAEDTEVIQSVAGCSFEEITVIDFMLFLSDNRDFDPDTKQLSEKAKNEIMKMKE